MTRQHPAGILVDEFANRNPGGCNMHTGFLHPAAYGERTQAFAIVATVRGEPFGTAFEDLAHPEERFHVVFERRTPEEPNLRNVGRTQPRHPLLAFDRLDHRRLFAADVRTRAAMDVDFAVKAAAKDILAEEATLAGLRQGTL